MSGSGSGSDSRSEKVWTCIKCTYVNTSSSSSSPDRICEICLSAFTLTSTCAKTASRKSAAPLEAKKQQQATILSFFSRNKSSPNQNKEEKASNEDVPKPNKNPLFKPSNSPIPTKEKTKTTEIAKRPISDLETEERIQRLKVPKQKVSSILGLEKASQGRILYSSLCEVLSKVRKTTKRLEKQSLFVDFFRFVLKNSSVDLLPSVFLSTDAIGPDYENNELGIGSRMVVSVILEATGVKKSELSKHYREDGDIGDAAFRLKSSQRTLFKFKNLTIKQVYDTMCEIARETGAGSQSRRKNKMLRLFRACKGEEIRFLVRFMIRNSRIGASRVSIIDALTHAAVWHHYDNDTREKKKTSKPTAEILSIAVKEVRARFNTRPDFRLLVNSLIEGGVAKVTEMMTPTVGIPIEPMLAKVCHSVSEFMEIFKRKSYTCEYKYDGQRIQVHFQPQKSFSFSRHCNSNTEQFPDAIEALGLAAGLKVKSCIIDAEIVAVDRSNSNKILAFQALSTRQRKDVETKNVTINVCLFVFDLLELNGTSLVNSHTLAERRRLLKTEFKTIPGRFELVHQLDILYDKDKTSDVSESREQFAPAAECSDEMEMKLISFLQKALHSSCEGVMVKCLNSKYEPSKRSDSWFKLKQDYIESLGDKVPRLLGGGLGDSLDLVPIGGWYGNGRKANFISPFLLACYDPETDMYFSVCRCMSGFSDEFYKEQNKMYREERKPLTRKPFNFITPETPSFWFEPLQVWELRGAELTLSPTHQAALGMIDSHPDRGVSVRFPRFIRVRKDKTPNMATTPQQLAQMFHSQTRKLTKSS